jgi:hypothetical protein
VQKQQFGSPRLGDNRLTAPLHHAAEPYAPSAGGARCLQGWAGAAPRCGSAPPPLPAPGAADQVRGRLQRQGTCALLPCLTTWTRAHLNCNKALSPYARRAPHLSSAAVAGLPGASRGRSRTLQPCSVCWRTSSKRRRCKGTKSLTLLQSTGGGQRLLFSHSAAQNTASHRPACRPVARCAATGAIMRPPVQQHTLCIFLTPPCCVCTLPAVEQ